MTNEKIKQLETELWGAADELRANSKLTAAEYKDPVLGLILLRYAQNKFEEAKKHIEDNLPVSPRGKRKVTKNDFLAAGAMYLQEKSQFDYLVNLPESQGIAEAVNNAMKLIEEDYPDLRGILPKNVYGTELKSNNVRLAKMNLAIHGIEGKIIEDNSFYSNPHNLTGKCDFVMANPPFNVKKIDKSKDYVKEDPRLPFGLPKNDNGNYMWIQYFYSYLNEKGRAGFVMASSATDAGNSEKLIRQQLIETGNVDVIVSVGNNFFYTRSLPCHLWFLDKGKPEANKDKILMLDARNTYRVVNSTINDFSDGQLLNLTTIVQLYRGNNKAIEIAIAEHKKSLSEQFETINDHYKNLSKELKEIATELKNNDLVISERIIFDDFENPEQAKAIFETLEKPAPKVYAFIKELEAEIAKITRQVEDKEIEKKTATAKMKPFKEKLNKLNKPLKAYQTETTEFLKEAKQRIGDWKKLLEWFPDNKYIDVEGLCKIVDLAEVKENDYSLTPGRYVGYSIQIDEDFDYKARMVAIHSELAELNNEANDLMNQILSVEL